MSVVGVIGLVASVIIHGHRRPSIRYLYPINLWLLAGVPFADIFNRHRLRYHPEFASRLRDLSHAVKRKLTHPSAVG